MQSWETVLSHIPNYEITKDNENMIDNYFTNIKALAQKEYNLADYDDMEVFDTLGHLYFLLEEAFHDDLDKVILLDYIKNFMKRVYQPLIAVTTQTDDPTSLRDNQKLFSVKKRATENNRYIAKECFNKYFCNLQGNYLISDVPSNSIKLKDNFLLNISKMEHDIFRKDLGLDPRVSSKHLGVEYNYDINYWRDYIDILLQKEQELLSYFDKKDGLDSLKEFQKIADIHYLYASYFKLKYSCMKNKTR